MVDFMGQSNWSKARIDGWNFGLRQISDDELDAIKHLPNTGIDDVLDFLNGCIECNREFLNMTYMEIEEIKLELKNTKNG